MKIMFKCFSLFALCSFIPFILYNYELYFMDSFCISLIIPSTYEDFIRCINTLKLSICNSVSFPNELIIIVSGVGNKNSMKDYNKYKILSNCTKRLIIKYRERIFNAASNRNYGYLYAHCTILSFFDIDDIMSIYRIAVVNKIFKENKVIDILFHPFTKNYKILDKENKTLVYNKNLVVNQYNIIKEKCHKTFVFDGRIYKCEVSNGFYITNGWPSLKRIIMKRIKYNESLYSTEDLDFISRVVRNGYNVGIFRRPLGYYIKDNKCENI